MTTERPDFSSDATHLRNERALEPITEEPQQSRQIYVSKGKPNKLNSQIHKETDDGNDSNDAERYNRINAANKTQPERSTQAGEVSRSVVSFGESVRVGRPDKQGSRQPNLFKTGNFIYVIIPPDGGYGWVILVVVFFCLMIIEGIIWTIGVMVPAIEADLSLTATDLAFVASTQMALLGSALINKFGFRLVAFCGALFASLGLVCGSFSKTQASLIVCYGVIGGVAMGMVLVSSMLIVHYYFESLRPIASAVSSTGSGVGLIVISLLNANLIASMGWRYTTRIHALLMLVVALLTCAYVEVEPSEVGGFKYIPGDDSDESLNSIELATETYSVYSLAKPDATGASNSAPQGSASPLGKSKSGSHRECCCCSRGRVDRRHVINRDPLDRQDIFYSGPPDYSRSCNMQLVPGEEKAQRISYTLSVVRPATRTTSDDLENWIPQKLKVGIYTLLDIKLIELTEFKLLLLCTLIFAMGVNIPFVYAISRAEIPSNLANLLPSVIGAVNVTFRILLGVCAYKTSFHMSYLSGLGLCVGGAAVLVSGFLGQDSVSFQFTFAVLFAIGIASHGALRVVIYVKVLGLEKLTNAFGLTTAIMGVGSFIGTYLSGTMLDKFHSYKPVFIFSGACIIISGLIQLIIPKYAAYCVALRQKRTQKRVRFTGTKWKWSDCWSMIF